MTTIFGVLALAGCSSNNSEATDAASPGGFADARLPDGGGPVIDCNPVNNTGCAPGEKCGVIVQSSSPNVLTIVDCVADGSVALGGSCAYDGSVADGGTGVSDCVGGTECNSGTCAKVCDADAATSDCETGDVCQQYNGFYDGFSFGWCEPSCDPTGDDGAGNPQTGCDLAGSNEGCYVNIFSLGSVCGGAFCDASNQCTEGSECEFINACHPGKACAAINAAGDSLLCAKLCVTPDAARGLQETDLPLAGDSAHNGQAPWNCARLNDGAGQPDDARPYPGFVCIPLGGDDAVRYWGDLTAADGWPYGSALGVCVDTSVDGDPYQFDPSASPAVGNKPWKPKLGAKDLLKSLRSHPDYNAIIRYLGSGK